MVENEEEAAQVSENASPMDFSMENGFDGDMGDSSPVSQG